MTGSLAHERRTRFTGAALVRLLAAMDDVDTPASQAPFAERLSQWFGWTEAISLSSALTTGPAADVRPLGTAVPSAIEREAVRTRAALVKLLTEDRSPARRGASLRRQPASLTPEPPPAEIDFQVFRERYQDRQAAMDQAIGPLRRRIRSELTGASPALARLAALDTVMEQVVGGRERVLLANVPLWLEQHFERLRRDARETAADASLPPPTDAAWLDTFRHDFRDVLLAELDLRMQPVDGLLDALRRATPDLP